MLLSHFTVFYFMSCRDISEWKASLTKPNVCKILMIFVLNNCKHLNWIKGRAPHEISHFFPHFCSTVVIEDKMAFNGVN